VRSTVKIVVATDGSVGSRAALRFAGRLAGRLRSAELVVITVGALRRELLIRDAGMAAVSRSLQPEIENQERELAVRILHTAELELRKRGRGEIRSCNRRAGTGGE
jgi:nucleotide-binding universal stress UspA family protein